MQALCNSVPVCLQKIAATVLITLSIVPVYRYPLDYASINCKHVGNESSHMNRFRQLFGATKPLIGMIHVRATPGSPTSLHSVDELVEFACQEAELYRLCHVDAVLVENMHDRPYAIKSSPGKQVLWSYDELRNHCVSIELISVMTRVCCDVRKVLGSRFPIGVQLLACQNREALAVAMAAALNFIRTENFVFGD